MNIERSEFGGNAYVFPKDEKAIIGTAFLAEIKKLEKKILKIEMHPKNEGQERYLYEIEILKMTIRSYAEIATEMLDLLPF